MTPKQVRAIERMPNKDWELSTCKRIQADAKERLCHIENQQKLQYLGTKRKSKFRMQHKMLTRRLKNLEKRIAMLKTFILIED